jgi:hypothetical protein
MIYFGRNETQMLDHMQDTMCDRIACDGDEYEPEDSNTVEKIAHMSLAKTGQLVVTGELLDGDAQLALYRQVVEAELDAWVPNASQRLLYRAARALDLYGREQLEPDHGDEPGMHALFRSYVGQVWVMQCSTCNRLFRA